MHNVYKFTYFNPSHILKIFVFILEQEMNGCKTDTTQQIASTVVRKPK